MFFFEGASMLSMSHTVTSLMHIISFLFFKEVTEGSITAVWYLKQLTIVHWVNTQDGESLTCMAT